MPRNWLFAPMDFNKKGMEGLSELTGMGKYISENEKDPKNATRFYDGDPITITLRGAMIVENMDELFRGENDLMILSTFQFGKEPAVQKLHFMQDEVECGWQGDFFNRIILALQDFKDINESLALRIQIYDLDELYLSSWKEGFKSLTEGSAAVKSLAEGAIAAFPSLTPYAVAVPLLNAIANLAENIDDHDKIIDEKIILESANKDTGHTLLQQGYYVCFNNPISQDQVKYLSNDLRVLDANKKEFEDFSYAVIEVHKDFREGVDLEIDQKAAKLASELNGKGQSGKAAIDFLRDTLSVYKDFKDLQREKELSAKEKDKTISESEKNLLKELRKNDRIKPYL